MSFGPRNENIFVARCDNIGVSEITSKCDIFGFFPALFTFVFGIGKVPISRNLSDYPLQFDIKFPLFNELPTLSLNIKMTQVPTHTLKFDK